MIDPNNSQSSNANTCSESHTYKGSLPPKPKIEFIEQMVYLLLQDPEFNIKRLPDAIESRVYKSVIYIIFDTIVDIIWNFNDTPLFGHVLEMEMLYSKLPESLPTNLEKLDKLALQNLVDSLMQQELLNLSWLPDMIEKNIYFCIILITFHILQIIASATVINMAGHSLHLRFGPNGVGFNKFNNNGIETKFQSILESDISQRNIDSLVDAMIANKELNSSLIPDFIEKNIYKSIYSLVLCLVDELFYDLHIDIMGNVINIRLTPDTWREVTGSELLAHKASNADTSSNALNQIQPDSSNSSSGHNIGMNEANANKNIKHTYFSDTLFVVLVSFVLGVLSHMLIIQWLYRSSSQGQCDNVLPSHQVLSDHGYVKLF